MLAETVYSTLQDTRRLHYVGRLDGLQERLDWQTMLSYHRAAVAEPTPELVGSLAQLIHFRSYACLLGDSLSSDDIQAAANHLAVFREWNAYSSSNHMMFDLRLAQLWDLLGDGTKSRGYMQAALSQAEYGQCDALDQGAVRLVAGILATREAQFTLANEYLHRAIVWLKTKDAQTIAAGWAKRQIGIAWLWLAQVHEYNGNKLRKLYCAGRAGRLRVQEGNWVVGWEDLVPPIPYIVPFTYYPIR